MANTDNRIKYWVELSEYDIETAQAMLRPTHKEQLLKSLTEERCSDIIKNAQELKEWISGKL